MLTEVRKHLKLIWLYFKFNLSASMEYRVSFLTQVFGMMLNNLSFVFFWWILFENMSAASGYTFKDVMFIWALAAASYGFSFVMFGNCRSITSIIINGELDAYLIQPKDVYINVLCSRTMVACWGDIAYGFTLYLVAYGFHLKGLLLFTGFTILGGLLITSVFASLFSLTFFIGNSSAIGGLYTEFLLNFSLYPESIFKSIVRWAMYSLIPAGFIVFVPLRLMKHFTFSGLVILLLVDAAYILFGYWLFHAGLKRYESGNLITTRL